MKICVQNEAFILMYKDLYVFVGQRIGLARTTANLSLDQVSNLTGIPAENLKFFERDSRGVTLEQLENIAVAVNHDIWWFFQDAPVRKADCETPVQTENNALI